jgi:hypothetical protein
MSRWRILVEGTSPQADTFIEGFRAALHPRLGSVFREGSRISMVLFIVSDSRHAAAQQALDLWWACLPDGRVQMFLIQELE